MKTLMTPHVLTTHTLNTSTRAAVAIETVAFDEPSGDDGKGAQWNSKDNAVDEVDDNHTRKNMITLVEQRSDCVGASLRLR